MRTEPSNYELIRIPGGEFMMNSPINSKMFLNIFANYQFIFDPQNPL